MKTKPKPPLRRARKAKSSNAQTKGGVTGAPAQNAEGVRSSALASLLARWQARVRACETPERRNGKRVRRILPHNARAWIELQICIAELVSEMQRAGVQASVQACGGCASLERRRKRISKNMKIVLASV